MTKDQVEAVFNRVRSWPAERQEQAARILVAFEGRTRGTYRLDADERADIDAALEEDSRGEFASDTEVEALFARLTREG
jgi:hypothetical protein